MLDFLNDKFSSRAKAALLTAQRLSQELLHPHTGTKHLLYGIVNEISSFASEVLLKNKISPEIIKLEIARDNFHEPVPAQEKEKSKLSKNLEKALETGAVIGSRYQYQFVGTEHLLFGLVDQDLNGAQRILARLNLNPKEIRKNLLSIFENVSHFPDAPPFMKSEIREGSEPPSALEYFTLDLTKKAKEGKIDPVIGRTAEIIRLISILSRRTKNNPVLIGDPGVGKTAIVEGLAILINEERVPPNLLGKRVLALDLPLIVAGSMFRGEFESRLKDIIDEIKELQNVIIFIDELHNLVGAGAAQGSMDAANILKPALARGELRAIGATTLTEYKKYIEGDPALERRFQPIIIREPSETETLEILKGLRPYYETHHEVKIMDDALAAAVKLSSRFISDRYLPDKAIDLLDETAAYRKTVNPAPVPNLAAMGVDQNLLEILEQKKKAVLLAYDFAAARVLKKREAELLQKKTKILQKAKSPALLPLQITAPDIAETITRITGFPLNLIKDEEAKRLLELEKNLKKFIIGQDEVLTEIAKSIRRFRTGIASQKRPLASFMFLGPSGTGKTLTAKILAQELFGNAESLLRIDMSEFMEKHNIARLIGAPAGYIGYEEGGRLTEAIRRRPYCVVLFDEIEKAHSEVLDILLQILEEGELTDAAGRKVGFKNTIILLTSNIGLSSLNDWARNFGFADSAVRTESLDKDSVAEIVKRQIQQHFRPEFLNRLDKILIFNPLSQKNLKQIVSLELESLQKKLLEYKITLQIPRQVIGFLAEKSLNHREGARLVRKTLQDLLEDPIAQNLLEAKFKQGDTITCQLTGKGTQKTVKIVS